MHALIAVARLGRPVSGRLGLAVLLGLGAALAGIGLTATSAWLVSRAAQQPPVLYLMIAITAVQAFGISRGVLRYGERLAAHDAAFWVLARLRGHAYRRLERLAPAGLAAYRSGDLLARLVADVDGLADLWLRVLLPYAIVLAAATVGTLLVGALVPVAGVVLGVTLVVVAFLVPLVAGAVGRDAERRVAPARGALAAAATDLLAGAPELLANGTSAGQLEVLGGLDGALLAAERRAGAAVGLGGLAAGLAAGAATWFALAAGVGAVRSGALDGVALAVVVLTPMAVHELAAGLVPAAQHLPGLAAAADRVQEVLRQPDPVTEPAAPAALPAGPYGLRLVGVAARYGDGPLVLHDVDLDLPAGGRALVSGPSGCGKSTLAALLLRFLDPTAGSVELLTPAGSCDVRRLASDDVRRVVKSCAQDPHVFDTTLGDNLRVARPDATDADLRDVLAAVRLAAWVETLPAGLTTPVGEHGARLSGGQLQRLALARALLADAPVLILDEPTEHLDEATAAALMADVLEATHGRTLLVLSHRTGLLAGASWDVHLELGRLQPTPSS